jgi:hypothetical protein
MKDSDGVPSSDLIATLGHLASCDAPVFQSSRAVMTLSPW